MHVGGTFFEGSSMDIRVKEIVLVQLFYIHKCSTMQGFRKKCKQNEELKRHITHMYVTKKIPKFDKKNCVNSHIVSPVLGKRVLEPGCHT